MCSLMFFLCSRCTSLASVASKDRLLRGDDGEDDLWSGVAFSLVSADACGVPGTYQLSMHMYAHEQGIVISSAPFGRSCYMILPCHHRRCSIRSSSPSHICRSAQISRSTQSHMESITLHQPSILTFDIQHDMIGLDRFSRSRFQIGAENDCNLSLLDSLSVQRKALKRFHSNQTTHALLRSRQSFPSVWSNGQIKFSLPRSTKEGPIGKLIVDIPTRPKDEPTTAEQRQSPSLMSIDWSVHVALLLGCQ